MLAGVLVGTLAASTSFRPASTPVTSAASAVRTTSTTTTTTAAAPERPSSLIDDVADSEAAFAAYVERVNQAATRVARATNTPGSLVRPSPGELTGWYGEGRRSHRHAGIDFDGDTGDAIVAAGSGRVVHAGGAPAGYGGYGLMVLVDHGNGVETLYAHLSRIDVAVGDEVHPGDGLGAMGTTGNVTGSHLHFEVRYGGRPVNPTDWLAG